LSSAGSAGANSMRMLKVCSTGSTVTSVVAPELNGKLGLIRQLRVTAASEAFEESPPRRPHAGHCREHLFRPAIDAAPVDLEEICAISRPAEADLRPRRGRSRLELLLQNQPAQLLPLLARPAFYCSPPTVRKEVQSSESDFIFWGSANAGPILQSCVATLARRTYDMNEHGGRLLAFCPQEECTSRRGRLE
jgi:hypothetical protein